MSGNKKKKKKNPKESTGSNVTRKPGRIAGGGGSPS